jgi:large subunit ribosomal protein L4
MAKLSIYNKEGKESGSFELPDAIFGERVNTHVIHQAVTKYHTSQRQGNACTKQRSDVSGGGKKPWRQKGTGRARHGSTRSPLWRHGATTFGPIPADFGYEVPRKVKQIALRESLNAKFQSKQLTCLADLKEDINKTKDIASIIKALKIKGSVLAVLDGSNKNAERVSRNIGNISVRKADQVNAFDVTRHKVLLTTKSGLEHMIKRVK